jgi:predicted phage-related endonuclease
MAANGRANEVILQKMGRLAPPDLSGVEAVQMGHVMEPVIGRLAQSRLGVDLQKIEHAYAHKSHPWFRSHFDFTGTQDGKQILVECKNYNAAVRQKFDPATGVMPAADMAQCIHEAAVMQVDTVYLAVLFGGQEFTLTRVDVTEVMKEDLIQKMAPYWAACVAGNPLPPESTDQARVLFPESRKAAVEADRGLEQACVALKSVKQQIKALEEQEEQLALMVQRALQEKDTLVDISGQVLATWKSAAASKKFDAKLFQQAMPDVYETFVREVPGSRRFLIK